jgi:hypothetical protein
MIVSVHANERDGSSDVTDCADALLRSPMGLYLLAEATCGSDQVLRGIHRGAVAVAGSELASALTNPERLLWLAFRHIQDWTHSPWRQEAAARLASKADLFMDAARALAASPAARWWHEPLDRGAQTTYASIETTQPPPHGVDLDADPSLAGLPASAVMTSTQIGSLPGGYLCGWDGSPEPLSIWHTPVRPDARVYEIHSPTDWTELVLRYPAETAVNTQQNPDWWLTADDWDGIHLSVAGYLTVPECVHWLHESTIWLKPLFEQVTRLPDWPYRQHYTNFAWPPPPWPAAQPADVS